MAKIKVGGKFYRAKVYRLPSSKPAYEFQFLFHVTRPIEFMQWRGQYPNGNFTDFIDIPKAEYPAWHRRIRAGEAKPEPQLVGDWSLRAARPADIATYYHNTVELAKRWYKGKRV